MVGGLARHGAAKMGLPAACTATKLCEGLTRLVV